VAKPTILTVDDDPAVSQAITRDLRRQASRFGAEIVTISSAPGATVLRLRLPQSRSDAAT